MRVKEFDYHLNSSLMEGYLLYLMRSPNMSNQKTLMTINNMRKFHNHVGKTYIDVTPEDIQGYLNFLEEYEQLKNTSVYRHLAAIRKFYDYLSARGELVINPCRGVSTWKSK